MRVLKKRYLKMHIRIASSLSIGSGENENTDHDILVNAEGIPYIPGSAVAGVTRHALSEANLLDTNQDKALFGNVIINTQIDSDDMDHAAESQIVTYDVQLRASDGEKLIVTNRDMVALDPFKTAITGGKFDMEVLEPGATGVVIIEQNQTAETDFDPLLEIARIWCSGRVRFGAKTNRGYGAIEVTDLYESSFDFSKEEEIRQWLAFSPRDQQNVHWKHLTDIKDVLNHEVRLVLDLQQVGGISIRKYTTEVCEKGTLPDYEQMTYANGDPVISGTSWAGAFRHAIEGMIGKDETQKYFGTVENGHKTRSEICFSESRITGGQNKQFTRGAVNRFTGGAANKSLYTERTYYHGHTQLTIVLRRNHAENQVKFQNALAAALVDLNEGFLSVGGETSIGRGLFTITALNGEKAADHAADLFAQIRKVFAEEGQA